MNNKNRLSILEQILVYVMDKNKVTSCIGSIQGGLCFPFTVICSGNIWAKMQKTWGKTLSEHLRERAKQAERKASTQRHRRKHGWGWGMEGGWWREGEREKVVETEVKKVMRSRRSSKGWCFLWMGSQRRVLNEVTNMIWHVFNRVLCVEHTMGKNKSGTRYPFRRLT